MYGQFVMSLQISKLQSEIDCEAEHRAELARSIRGMVDKKLKSAIEAKIEKSDEKLDSMTVLMLHYCAGLQHCPRSRGSRASETSGRISWWCRRWKITRWWGCTRRKTLSKIAIAFRGLLTRRRYVLGEPPRQNKTFFLDPLTETGCLVNPGSNTEMPCKLAGGGQLVSSDYCNSAPVDAVDDSSW